MAPQRAGELLAILGERQVSDGGVLAGSTPVCLAVAYQKQTCRHAAHRIGSRPITSELSESQRHIWCCDSDNSANGTGCKNVCLEQSSAGFAEPPDSLLSCL